MKKQTIAIFFIAALFFIGCSPKDQTQAQVYENDFTLVSLDNEEITLSDLKGKVVLVDFWATWCPPCVQSIPVFSKLYNKYHDKGFMALGISREDRSILENYRDKIGIPYPILIDDKKITMQYGVKAIPTIIIFDKSGKKRKTQVGFAPELEVQFETLIDSLLKEK
jgi:thiol-disulfide isomerase/thioredoxin